MKPTTPAQRREIISLVETVFGILDKTGGNKDKWGTFLREMKPKAFDRWLAGFLKDDGAFLDLEVMPFENEPGLREVRKAAAALKVPLEEHVRHSAGEDGETARTDGKVPVGWIHVRRLQQMLAKKNSFTTNISRRNQLTGQVTRDSKVARVSMTETNALMAQEAMEAAREFLGPRADNHGMKLAMYNQISRDGHVSAAELERANNPLDRSTIMMMNALLAGAGLQSDLVTFDDSLPGH